MFRFKNIKHILTFYKFHYGFSIIISLLCALILHVWKYHIGMLIVLFWFKIITQLFTCLYINNFNKKYFFYFQALGLSKAYLWLTSFSFKTNNYSPVIYGTQLCFCSSKVMSVNVSRKSLLKISDCLQ